jgi:transposase InsO family protein
VSTPRSINEAIFFCSPKVAHVSAKVNGRHADVIIDSGASVPVVNDNFVDRGKVFQGKEVKLFDWRGKAHTLSRWANILLEVGPVRQQVACLVITDVSYDMLVSRPLMKSLKMNLHFDDQITYGDLKLVSSVERSRKSPKCLRSVQDIEELYPNVVCRSDYPPPVKFFAVPFKLASDTIICRKPYTLSRNKQEFMQEELERLKSNGIIRSSDSPYASPVILVPKSNGTWRMCTDYRAINENTALISWPLPIIDEIIAETGGCEVFSTMDLLKGFWQQPLTEDTKRYSAFVTPFGTFEYNVNPFGWKNSPKYFQKMMDEVLAPHRAYCRWYIDDIVVFSKDEQSHERHLKKVLSALNEAELKVNLEKSTLFKNSVVFLGRTIDGKTKSTKEASVEKVRNIVAPTNLKQLQRFLGLCGHFRSFIKDYSKITRPLAKLTLKDEKFEWTKDHQAIFEDLKTRITVNPVLVLPDFSKPFILTTDASDLGTGSVLTQRSEGKKEHVVGYQSYTFNKAERNYSTSEKEMLAVLKAVHYFRSYLDGRKFTLFTDHSALKELLKTKEPKGRVARWILKLSEMDFVVEHKPGRSISHADAMSRLPQEGEQILLTTCINEKGRLEVKPEDRKEILELYHDSPASGGHDGIWRTYLKISKRFSWPKLKHDVTAYVRSCPMCQKNKAKFRPKADRLCFRANDEPPMHTVHLDFAELSKTSGPGTKTRAFLVAIDRNSRFAVSRAGRENADAVIDLLSQKVFEKTRVVVSDHARVFESKKFREWAERKGIQICLGSPYNPQSNGLAERLIRDLKTFMAMYPSHMGGWKRCLESAVRHHNYTHCSTIGCTPVFALRGEVAYLPADDTLGVRRLLSLRERRKSPDEEHHSREKQKKNFDRRHTAKISDLVAGDKVLVKEGNTLKYAGPFTITEVENFNGIPKRISYRNEGGVVKTSSLKRVFKYCPRSDNIFGGESSRPR